jgi:superfamily II DNA or RNA helicase
MWPWRPPTVDVKTAVSYDRKQGLLFVTFQDHEGQAIDGTAGLDALAKGFEHRGRKVRLASAAAQLLAQIVEHGGRWVPGQGFALRDEDVPDALRAFRALPESVAPVESAEVRALEIDARPLELADHAELEGDEQLRRVTSFRDATGERSVPIDTVAAQQQRAWIRTDAGFHRRPALTRAEIDAVTAAPAADVLTGDDVPYFLAKQLLEARSAGRRVVLGPRAAGAQVLGGDWLPEVAVDVEKDRLRVDVGFKTGTHRVPWKAAVDAGKRRYVALAKDTWAKNDRAARKRVEDALGEIPELRPDRDTGSYEAPAYALPVIQEAFASLGTLSLSESARVLHDKLLDFRRIEPVVPPRSLKATLREYQQHGLNWLCFLRKYGLSGILADDMGLGKTVQTLSAILAAHEAGQVDPSLVVCPASVMSVWEQEVGRWCEGVRPVVLAGHNRSKYLRDFPERTVAITSYASVARSAEAYGEKVWNYVVLDEAHRVKNHTTASAKACKGLLARHKVAVTGTPIQNRLRDVWALYDSILPGHLGENVAAFERNFGGPIEKHKDEAAAERLRRRIDPFKLRRLKTEVAKDLPALSQQTLPVALLEAQHELYAQLAEEILPAGIEALRDASRRGSPLEVLEKLLRLRQVCAHPKLIDPALPLYETSAKFEELRELVAACLAASHKVLVFTQWKSMAELIREHLTNDDVPHGMLDGSVPADRRAELVKDFQRPDGPPVMIVSLLAGGEGITLTEADTVIMYDRWWNPAVEDQAIARAHRIGQQRPVTAYILEAQDTIEQRLAAMLASKRHLAEDLIHVDAAEKRIQREDLLAILHDELAAARKQR